MNKISASFNFPPDFIWGIVPPALDDQETDIMPYLFNIQEMNVHALYVSIPWAKCEPLKGQYDEVYIDSVRQQLLRIRNRNILPVIVPDTLTQPAWLNLSHSSERTLDMRSGIGFVRHLAESTAAYTDSFGIPCSVKRNLLRPSPMASQQFFSESIAAIHDLMPGLKAGIIFPNGLPAKHKFLIGPRFGFLKHIRTDFLGIPISEDSEEAISRIFGNIRIPTMFISDGLAAVTPEDQIEKLMDQVFSVWRLYQNGMPVIGYFSELKSSPDSLESLYYTQLCKNNAFQISTDMEWLPEKWKRFLKD